MTPVAIVVYAGYKEKEKVIKGTLKNIAGKVDNEKLPFEHLIHVGIFLDIVVSNIIKRKDINCYKI